MLKTSLIRFVDDAGYVGLATSSSEEDGAFGMRHLQSDPTQPKLDGIHRSLFIELKQKLQPHSPKVRLLVLQIGLF